MNNDRVGKKYGNRAIQNLMESPKTNRIIFGAIVAVTFIYMVFLNIKTPLIADDFAAAVDVLLQRICHAKV